MFVVDHSEIDFNAESSIRRLAARKRGGMKAASAVAAGMILGLAALTAPTISQAAPIAKGTDVHILALGDSITEGKFTTDGGYRGPLQDLLKSAGFTVTFVGKEDNGDPANDTGFSKTLTNANHEGYGSIRIDQVTRGGGAEGHSVPAIGVTLANDKPDVVLVMLGTNDLLQNHALNQVLGRLDTLVNDIFTDHKGVKVILATAPPMTVPERDELAAIYASGVPLIVDKYKALGYDITLADMFTGLDPATDLGDGVHPKPIGYEKMANVWFQALTGITPKPIESPASGAAATASSSPTAAAAPGKQGALSFTSATHNGAGGPFSLGFRFTTGPSDVTVTSLGYLNDGATGAQAVHSVGIYADSTKELLGTAISVTTSGGDLTGTNATFTYVKLPTPVHLTANTSYDVVGTMVRTGFLEGLTGVAWAGGIVPSSGVAVFNAGATLAFPAHSISSNGCANIGPNFLIAGEESSAK